MLYNRNFPSTFRLDYHAEKNFPTEQPASRQDPRLSQPHENREWTGRPFSPPRDRPQETDRQLRALTRSRQKRNQQAFQKVSGCCGRAISEESMTRVHAIAVPSSPHSLCLFRSFRSPSRSFRSRKRPAPSSVSRLPGRSERPLFATGSDGACVKRFASICHH